jgi:release factor glutamine methyltransferase
VISISEALLEARSRGLERLDTHLLLLHALGRPGSDRAWLLSHDTDTLDTSVQATFATCVTRRAQGEPLAYITGHKEFFGLDLLINRHVLIPRPDTETLVEWALETLATTRDANVVDLGTGSGAIALALKSAQPGLRVIATDISAEALALARANAQRHHLELQFLQSSWLDGLPTRYQAIVSNPPYVAEGDNHLEALRHEPLSALTSGTDGLNDIRRIVAQAVAHLIPGGWLLLEHGHQQGESVRSLLIKAGLADVQSRRDLSGIERCSGARLQPES